MRKINFILQNTPPIVLRAQVVKKELEETKILKQKLESRETDIKV